MSFIKRTGSKKNMSMVRVISAVLVLGVLVLIVAESAKYLHSARIPKSVSSKIEPSVDKLASVLGVAKSSLESLDNQGSVSISESVLKVGPIDTKIILKVALLADSHNDLENLDKALSRSTDYKVNQIIFLGDYTDWGELQNLQASKIVMDKYRVPYYSVPGDHDLGETRDESNFVKVFGKSYGVLEQTGVKLMYFDNSKNYTTISESSVNWFTVEIKDTDFLFLSQPVVTESMARVMGIVDGVKDEMVFTQNLKLLEMIRASRVRAIVSGDLHQATRFQDPVKTDLWHYSVGGLLRSQSLEKINLQSPRFAILTVKEDFSYQIDDITLD